MRSENARALSDGERQLSALRAQIAACEERAQGARDATAEAESAYADAQKRLASRAAENSALRFLRAPAVQVRVSHAQPSAGELLSDVRARMAAAGFPVSHDRAVELLAALTLCPVTILCGGAFAPKGEVVRALGESLGLGQRLLALACVRRQEPMVDALLEDASGLAPALIWMENCNAPERAPHAEALRLRINALAPEHPARLVLTASDDGLCLPVELLDGAFLLRLEPESASSPWHEAPASFAPPEGAISMEALRSVFRPCPEAVTEEAIARMARLRQALGERGVLLSRRTLNAVWSLCAAIAPLLSERSPMRALDIALARRALPAVLAAAPMEALNALPEMVTDLEECQKLLESPLPIF